MVAAPLDHPDVATRIPLDDLAEVEPDLAGIIELKFFCGFSFTEIAALCREFDAWFIDGQQAGTLSGNPLAMTAGLETLKAIEADAGFYHREKRNRERGGGLAEALADLLGAEGADAVEAEAEDEAVLVP